MTLRLPAPIVVDSAGRLVPASVQQDFDMIARIFPLSAYSSDGGGGGGLLGQVPQVRAYLANTTGAIATGAWTAIGFDGEDYDLGTADGMHDTVTNNTRITCRVAGLYTLTANVCWNANAVGSRGARFRLNGAGFPYAEVELAANVAANFTQLNLAAQMRLVAGDYVEVEAAQTSGGGLTVIQSSAVGATQFTASWESP